MKMSERRKFQMERIGNAEALRCASIWSVQKKEKKKPPQKGQCDWRMVEPKERNSIGDKKELGREKMIVFFPFDF